MCKTLSAAATRSPGLSDCNPVTESAPKRPIASTPNKSRPPINICKTITTDTFRLSALVRIFKALTSELFCNRSIDFKGKSIWGSSPSN